MTRSPVWMKGRIEFYPFCYMLIAADNALITAKMGLAGRNYHYVSAVVFSAFAVEAAVNHVGVDHVSTWMEKEERKSWQKKLKLLAKRFEMTLDFQSDPEKTVKAAFGIRDKMAHGKTWEGHVFFLDEGQGMGDAIFPDWLVPYFSEERVANVIADSRSLISRLLEKAGYPSHDLTKLGGSSSKAAAEQVANQAIWKIKGT